ncbi:MAG: undecaprenyl-diphosphate phosphatase [Candidatus Magasanikbacteria bacterium]|nr:undecaprenyl-diphosphate phosphatase [Candidatus Magasanikbacteria bacterium]
MTILQSITLGIIQGLTEFLPVSSSGHLIFIPKLFGWADQGIGFDVVMHLGTLLAVVVYFREKLWMIFCGFLGIKIKKFSDFPSASARDEGGFRISDFRRLAWLLILSIIPAGIIGLLFGDAIEQNLRIPEVIAIGFIFWGLVLWFADTYGKKENGLEKLNWKNALFIGCVQAIALIPGTSRSGITMTAGLFSKLDKKSTAEFSFLMSVPIIFLAGMTNVFEMFKNGLGDLSLSVLATGFIASMLSGFFAIWGLMKIIQKWSFRPFVVYRIVVGLAILFFLI